LLTTLYDKNKYIIHYRNLHQALYLGLTLKKIHRCLKFKQSRWRKKIIDLNIELRKLCVNEFGKQVNFNKPIYIGMSISDISKTILYDFHYNYIFNNFVLNYCILTV
jgi:hypothetical protein